MTRHRTLSIGDDGTVKMEKAMSPTPYLRFVERSYPAGTAVEVPRISPEMDEPKVKILQQWWRKPWTPDSYNPTDNPEHGEWRDIELVKE